MLWPASAPQISENQIPAFDNRNLVFGALVGHNNFPEYLHNLKFGPEERNLESACLIPVLCRDMHMNFRLGMGHGTVVAMLADAF